MAKKFDFHLLFSGLLPLFVLAHFGHHLLTALPTPLLPMIRADFNLDYTQSGLVISAFTLAYGFGQIPSGWLADRIGRRIVTAMGICGVALAGVLVGLSHSYIMMIVFLALMGVMGGGYHPSAPPLVTAAVEPQNRGRALGLHAIGGSASFFLAPLIAAAIAVVWGWRGSFIALAIPTVALGIWFYVMLGRRLPATKPGEAQPPRSAAAAPAAGSSLRRLVPFIVFSIAVQATIFSILSFIPLFVVDVFGASKETGAAFVSILYSAGLWAGPLGGYFCDRWGAIRVMLAVGLAAGPAIYLLSVAPYSLGIGALLLALGIITYFRMPASEAYIIQETSERNRSTILGIYFFSSMESGGVLTPVVGNLIDRFGFHFSFAVLGLALLVVTLVSSIWLMSSLRVRPTPAAR